MKDFWKVYNDNFVGENGGFGDFFNQFTSIHRLGHVLSQASLLQFLFWGVVGLFIYVSIWLIRNIAVEIYNDVAISKNYLDETDPEEKNYWRHILILRFIFVFCLVLFAVYLVEASKWISPMANTYYSWLVTRHTVLTILYAVGLVACAAILLQLFLVLLRLVGLSLKSIR